MTDYELLLEVAPLSDEQEDAILDAFDAFVAGHDGTTLLTITASGPTCESAFRSVVHALAAHRVVVRRLVEDLVTRKTIASRADVTTQSVGLWIRGERRSDDPFPQPFTLAGGGLWLWGEVNAWLGRNDQQHDDIAYPTRADYVRCNAWLLDTRTPSPYWQVLGVTTMPAPAATLAPAPAASGKFLAIDVRIAS